MKFITLLFAAVVGFSVTANAGIFIEPYAGYGMSKFKYTGTTEKGDRNNGYYGARLGWQFHNWFFIGGDYSTTFGGKLKSDSGTNYDSTKTATYGVIGGDWDVFRVWAGYGFGNELELKSGGTSTKYNGGSHYKVGVGYKIFPLVALTVEYLASNTTKQVQNGSKSDIKTSDNEVRLGFSIPFTFGDGGGKGRGRR